MSFRIKILGNNSAIPAFGRNPSAQLVILHNQYLLIDCGEGTLSSLLNLKINFNKINHIFISHLHGDHYYGIMGLISSMQLYGRKKSLNVYAPPLLEDIIHLNLKASDTTLNFDITFHTYETETNQILLDHKYFTVASFPLEHRVVCYGFVIKEKPKPYRIRKEMLHEGIKLQYIGKFLKGEDIQDEQGNIIYKKADYTLPPKKSRAYVYCSDTRFNTKVARHFAGADVLYHEATFLEDLQDRAIKTFHSTAKEAAMVAREANVERLYLGHYSSRYKDLEPFLTEARQEFKNSYLSEEGKDIVIED